MRRFLVTATLLAALLASVPVHAGWEFARNWQELSDDERERAEKGRKKYERLPDGERGRFERNRQIWEKLSPEKRQDIRKRFDERRDRYDD